MIVYELEKKKQQHLFREKIVAVIEQSGKMVKKVHDRQWLENCNSSISLLVQMKSVLLPVFSFTIEKLFFRLSWTNCDFNCCNSIAAANRLQLATCNNKSNLS